MSKKVLYTLEYPVRCSPGILYEFLITPAGLQEWFADKVDERDGQFSFSWNGTEEKAELIDSEEDKFVRFRWDHM
ncbi:MAG: START-like domain-containing protein, partial [Ferruginibacter sp.]